MKEYVPFEPTYWFRMMNRQKSGGGGRASAGSELEQAIETAASRELPPRVIRESAAQQEDLLESIIGARAGFLAQEIARLKQLEQARLYLSSSLQSRIEYALLYHKNLIYELDFWPRGSNSAVEKRRIHLEKLRSGLEQEQRGEVVAVWRDVLAVSRDMRALMKEYVELGIRRRILEKDE